MTNTKHTPGPWEIRNANACAQDKLHIDSNGVPIATVKIINLKERKYHAGPDARLIAAASELLEALEGLLFVVRHSAVKKGEEEIRAEVAIAKAKGENYE